MTLAIKELNESLRYMTPITSQDTSRPIWGKVDDTTRSTVSNVYFFVGAAVNQSVPSNFKNLDDVIKKYEATPSRAAAMVRAKKKIAERLSADEFTTTLAELRLRAGMSQSKLAEALGNSQPSYSMIESGKHDIMFGTFEKLVNLLGVTRDELAESIKNIKNYKND